MSFAERLSESRRVAGLSQSELARRIGVKPQSVQQWEQSGTTPRAHRIKDLALALGVTREWLLVGGMSAESVRDVAHSMREVSFGQLCTGGTMGGVSATTTGCAAG